MRNMVYIYKHFSNNKKDFFILVLLTVLPAALATFQPLLLGNLIDNISSNDTKKTIYIILILFSLYCLIVILKAFQKYKSIIFTYSIQFNLKSNIIKNIFNYSLNEFNATPNGELINKIENDTRIYSQLYLEIIRFLVDFIIFLLTFFILFKISISLSIILMIMCPIIVIVYTCYSKLIKKLDNQFKISLDYYLNYLNETLESFILIQSFSYKKIMLNKYQDKVRSYQKKNLEKFFLNIKLSTIIEILSYSTYILILIIGATLIMQDRLSIGELVAFSTYAANFNQSLLRFSQVNILIQEAIISIKRIENIHRVSPAQKIIFQRNDLNICLNIINLNYSYDNHIIFKNFNCSIDYKQVLQITGNNGSGKSTLFKIIAGLINNYQGDIFIKGMNIKSFTQDYLNSKVCLVSQTHDIISGTFKENILLSKNNISEKNLIEACSKVNIHEFIISFEDSYETMIGKKGVPLSIGQQQRISLARAILVNADIYLFDEATASLDKENKILFYDLLKYLKKKNKTILIVSHEEIPNNIVDVTIKI